MDTPDQHTLSSQGSRPNSHVNSDGSPTVGVTSLAFGTNESKEMQSVAVSSSHQPQAEEDQPGLSDETRGNLRDMQKDSGISLDPPVPEPLQDGVSQAEKRRYLFCQSGRRKSSAPSVVRQRDSVRWSSVSDDSAIDMNSVPSSSVSVLSNYPIEERDETIIHYNKNEEENDTKETDINIAEHNSAGIEQNGEDTEKNDTEVNDIDAQERDLDAEKRRPLAERIFRGLFRLCFCNHTSKAANSKESFTNQGFDDENPDDSSYSETIEEQPGAQFLSSELSTSSVFSENVNRDTSAAMDALVTLDKEDFLSLFDSMCQEAKENGYDVVGRVVNLANFAAAMLDSRGGILSIDALGVHLYIPPGAISADEPPQRVYIYVQGSLTSGRNCLTPYVHCGPSRFEFRKDVILILPHCVKDALDTKFTCVKSSSNGNQTIEEGKDGNVLVRSKSILLTMRHFCGLAAYGCPLDKYMVACVFIKQSSDGHVTVRVRLLDDIRADLQEVQRVETNNGFIQVDMPGPLEVKRTSPEQDVKINLMCSDTDAWEVTDPKSGWQTVKHSILWRDRGLNSVPSFPSKLFKASKRTSSESSHFEGYLKVFQEGQEDQSVDFVLNSSFHAAKATIPGQLTKEQVKDICRQQIMEQLRGPVTENRLLDEDTLMKLCTLLDQPSPIGHDWRILPEKLTGLKEKGHGWVDSIKTRADSGLLSPQSPTEHVLNAFFATSRESDLGNSRTLQELKKGLLSLKRPDVQFAIDVIGGDQVCPDGPKVGKHNKTTEREQDQQQLKSHSYHLQPSRETSVTATDSILTDLGRDRVSSMSKLLSMSRSEWDPDDQLKKLDDKKRIDSAYESSAQLHTVDD